MARSADSAAWLQDRSTEYREIDPRKGLGITLAIIMNGMEKEFFTINVT